MDYAAVGQAVSRFRKRLCSGAHFRDELRAIEHKLSELKLRCDPFLFSHL